MSGPKNLEEATQPTLHPMATVSTQRAGLQPAVKYGASENGGDNGQERV